MENMKQFITVDTGERRVPIQDKDGNEIGAFSFHPTDIGIITRYNEMVDEFGAITEPLEAVWSDENASEESIAEALKAAENRLYGAVDRLFNSDGAAAAFFGKMNPFSPVNGLFYCEVVLESVGQYIGAQFEQETAKFSARVEKYTNRATRRKAAKK